MHIMNLKYIIELIASESDFMSTRISQLGSKDV